MTNKTFVVADIHGENRKQNSSIVFSDILLLGSIFIALVLCTSQPIFGNVLSTSILKHFPLVIFLVAFALHMVGRRITFSPKINSSGVVLWLSPFLVLGLYALTGSLYAKYTLKIDDTFLNLGIYLLMTPLFFIWGREDSGSYKIVRALIFLWGVTVLMAIIGTLARIMQIQALHEIEFLVLPFFLYLYYATKSYGGRVFSLALLLLTTILCQKLTGYVIGISAFIYIGLIYIRDFVKPNWKGFVYGSSGFLLILFIGILIFGYIYFRQYLPSGNPEVRLHQYEIAFSGFLKSPLWGNAYIAGAGEVYIENLRKLNIPTHSDILDLLKQGGIVAFLLWGVGMLNTIKLFIKSTHLFSHIPQVNAFFHAMVFMNIAEVFTYAFNPMLLKPPFAFVIWGLLSYSAGLATSSNKGETNAD